MHRTGVKTTILLLLAASLTTVNAIAMVGSTSTGTEQSNQWIPVPSWMAGTWQTRFQTYLDSYDCKTGQRLLEEPVNLQVSRQRTIGTQQDSSGQIWHYAATPFARNSVTELFIESQVIQQISPLRLDQAQVRLKTVGLVNRWSRQTREKLETFYESTVATYTPLNPGVIKTDLEVTDYDTQGIPFRTAHSVCVERCIKPFAIINYDERGDLRDKFARFQAARNAPLQQIERLIRLPGK